MIRRNNRNGYNTYAHGRRINEEVAPITGERRDIILQIRGAIRRLEGIQNPSSRTADMYADSRTFRKCVDDCLSLLQDVQDALYNGDYSEAFESQTYKSAKYICSIVEDLSSNYYKFKENVKDLDSESSWLSSLEYRD